MNDNCKKWNEFEKQRIKLSFVATLVFSLAAHGFAYFNFYPQHDAINHALYFAGTWEVQLGRFLLPIYGRIRGNITMPWIIGMLSIVYMSCVVYLVTEILELRQTLSIIFTAGILCVNLSVTELCAVFIFVEDAYMLSLMLGCLGVYVVKRTKNIRSVLIASFCFFCSLGLYQTYITSIVFLMIIIGCQDIIKNNCSVRELVSKYTHFVVSLFLGVGIYFTGYRIAMLFWNTKPANSYNSVSQLSTLSANKIMSNTIKAYENFIDFFVGKNTIIGDGIKYCNITLAIIAVCVLFYYLLINKTSILRVVLLVTGIVICPIVVLLMDIMMGTNRIMFYVSYALFLIYPVMVWVIHELGGDNGYSKKSYNGYRSFA